MPSFEGRPFAFPLSLALSLNLAALSMPLSQGAAQAAVPRAAPDPVAEAVEVARVWLDAERAYEKLEWIGGDTFRRVREDGDPGEEIRFERDASGDVIGVRWWANLWPRIRP